MASSPFTPRCTVENGSKSFFQKAVYLVDWWLLKADSQSSGKRLGVGGFTLRNNVRQEFSSAPIVKVFESFILGFPYQWEIFAAKDAWEASPPKAAPDAVLGVQKSSLRSQSVPEARRTRSMKSKDVGSPKTHEPICIKKSKINSVSEINKQGEEAEDEMCTQKNLNTEDCISLRLRSRHNKQNHTSEGGMAVCGVASTSGSNTKEKLDYESLAFKNGIGKASAVNVEPSMPDGLKSATQGCNDKSIDGFRRGNLEDEINVTPSKKYGGVHKVFIPKNVSKCAQSDPGYAHSANKKTCCRKEAGSFEKMASPQSLTLKRSRSGRLLLPPLEFWRNQRAVYNLERKVTGIVDDQNFLI
ncbi:hypothetical protein DM860_007222 [Cuscuta australis]|uniref:SANTA domain-containing protein n=1 Tax=Cuscuta australis TaxID=267555 RepID=A0A328E334_9ASTE|nr:hypothetical protein DM860_007222 [Cuscuta australis]